MCASGYIVRIRDGKAENITKVDGKPNGFEFDATGSIFISLNISIALFLIINFYLFIFF